MVDDVPLILSSYGRLRWSINSPSTFRTIKITVHKHAMNRVLLFVSGGIDGTS